MHRYLTPKVWHTHTHIGIHTQTNTHTYTWLFCCDRKAEIERRIESERGRERRWEVKLLIYFSVEVWPPSTTLHTSLISRTETPPSNSNFSPKILTHLSHTLRLPPPHSFSSLHIHAGTDEMPARTEGVPLVLMRFHLRLGEQIPLPFPCCLSPFPSCFISQILACPSFFTYHYGLWLMVFLYH